MGNGARSPRAVLEFAALRVVMAVSRPIGRDGN